MQVAEYSRYDGLGLAELIRNKQVSADEVYEAAVRAIDQTNPEVNAVIHRFDGGVSGRGEAPFTGVPFLVKDLGMHVAGEPISSGSRLFAGTVSKVDSSLIMRYRQAGLRLIGKTNTPELGLTTTTEPVLHGPTKNPLNLEFSAGGSSGGAAAAVASGMVPMAHASDGGGSIRIPASCCGLVGLKPTRARVPLGPDALEGWGGLSTTHAVTRSVRDSAALLDISCGEEPGAPYFAPSEPRSFLLTSARDPESLRIGTCRTSFAGGDAIAEIQSILDTAAQTAIDLGHCIDERTPLIDAQAFKDSHGILAISQVAATIEAKLAQLGRPLAEGDVERITFGNYQSGHEYTGAQYAWAQNQVRRHGLALARYFEDFDLLMTPTMACLPPRLGELDMMTEDLPAYVERLYKMIGFTALFNDTGLPGISLPLGMSEAGLPVGIQFVAPMGSEGLLLSLAGQFERAGLFVGSAFVTGNMDN